MTNEKPPPGADMVPQPISPPTVKPMLGVGAAGETLDELDEFVRDARRAGIPGHSTVWSGSSRGFRLSTGRNTRWDEPIRTPRWTGPRSITEPVFLGPEFGVDVLRDAHGLLTGRSEAGMTQLVNAHLYETTRSTDCVNWLITDPDSAVRRLKPWLAHWLLKAPHPDDPARTVNPALDWVAPSWDEGCRMLLDVYKAVGVRQELDGAGDQWTVSNQAPAIALYLHGIELMLDARKHPVPAFDGCRYTFGELLARVLRVARPEAIRVVLVAPSATNGTLGVAGGDIRPQFGYRLAGRATARTNSLAEAMAAFHDAKDVNLGDLPDGAFYGERRNDPKPLRVMGYRYDYEDIAWAAMRHGDYAASLDAGTADRLDHYAQRWTRPDQQAFSRRLVGVQAGDGKAAG
jgi:hypothetical protein